MRVSLREKPVNVVTKARSLALLTLRMLANSDYGAAAMIVYSSFVGLQLSVFPTVANKITESYS